MRPLDLLNLNLNQDVVLQLKRNQRLIGKIVGFDEHLNLSLENVKNIYYVEKTSEGDFGDDDDEDENEDELEYVEPELTRKEEDLGNIVLRGDNVIFMKIEKPIFSRPRKQSYRKPYDRRRGSPPRRRYNNRPPRRNDRGR